MSQRVFIAAEIARDADVYHTKQCQNVSESTLTQVAITTARNNRLGECPVCSGDALTNGLAGELSDMSPSEVGL